MSAKGKREPAPSTPSGPVFAAEDSDVDDIASGDVLKPIRRPPEPRPILTFDIETETGPWKWRKSRWEQHSDGWRKVTLDKEDWIRYRSIVPYAVGLTYRENLKRPARFAPTVGKERTVLFRGRGRSLMLGFLQHVLRPEFAGEWIWAHNLRGFDGRFVIDAFEDEWFTRRFRADLIETRAGVIAIDITPLNYTTEFLAGLEEEKKDASREEIAAIDDEIAFAKEWQAEVTDMAELMQAKFALKKKPKRVYWRFADSLQLVKMGLGSKVTIPLLCERGGQKVALRVAMSTRHVTADAMGVALRDSSDRIIVSKVRSDSRAAIAGLQAGDAIVEVNRKPVASVADVEQAFGASQVSTGFAATFGRGGPRQIDWSFHGAPDETHSLISDGDKMEMDHVAGSKDPRWPNYLANDLCVHRWAMEGLQELAIEQGGQLGITIASMAMWWYLARHYHPGGAEEEQEDTEPKRGPGRPSKNPPPPPRNPERERFDTFIGGYVAHFEKGSLPPVRFEDSSEVKLAAYRALLAYRTRVNALSPRGIRSPVPVPTSHIKLCPLCYDRLHAGGLHAAKNRLDDYRKRLARWRKNPASARPERKDALVKDCDECMPLMLAGSQPNAACGKCEGTGAFLAKCETCEGTGAYLEAKGREGGHHQWVHRNADFEAFLRRAVAGGRTEIFRMGGGPLTYLDFNSLYPSIAANVPMPTGKAFEIHKAKGGTRSFARTAAIDAVNDHGDPVHVCEACRELAHEDIFEICDRFGVLVGFVHCDVEIPDDVEFPPLGVKHEVNGVVKYIFPTGRLTGTWTTHELRLLEEVGGRIARVHRALWQETQTIFGDYVDACWGLRERGSKEKKPGLRELGKAYGNNLLGKWAMRRERTTTFMDPTLDPAEIGTQLNQYREKLRDLAATRRLPPALSPPPPPNDHIELCGFCYELLERRVTREDEEQNLARYRHELGRYFDRRDSRPSKARGKLGRFVHDCTECVPLLKAGARPGDGSHEGKQLAACELCAGTGAWLGRCPTCSGDIAFLNLAPCLERPAGAGFFSKKTDAGNAKYIIPAINSVVTSMGRVRLWRVVWAVHKAGGWVAYVDTDSALIGGVTLEQIRSILPEVERLDANGRIERVPPIGKGLGQLKHEHDIVEYKALRPKLYKYRCALDCPCGEGGEWHAAAKGFGRGFASKTKDSKRDAIEAIDILDRQLKDQGSFVLAETLLSHRAAFARKMYDEPVIIEQKRGLNGAYDKRHVFEADDLKRPEFKHLKLTKADLGVRTWPLRVDMWSQREHLLDLLAEPSDGDESETDE